MCIIAELTGAVCRAGKRSLHVRCAVSGQAPCSGAKRQGKGLDEVSSAIHDDAVAMNKRLDLSHPSPLSLWGEEASLQQVSDVATQCTTKASKISTLTVHITARINSIR